MVWLALIRYISYMMYMFIQANTRLLEGLMGWSGLCIEGNPIKFEQLKVARPPSS